MITMMETQSQCNESQFSIIQNATSMINLTIFVAACLYNIQYNIQRANGILPILHCHYEAVSGFSQDELFLYQNFIWKIRY